MTTQRPERRYEPVVRKPEDGHDSHGSHRWLMIVCCVPMLVIAGALVAIGVAGSGFVIAALACTAMMIAMMFMMPGGTSRGR